MHTHLHTDTHSRTKERDRERERTCTWETRHIHTLMASMSLAYNGMNVVVVAVRIHLHIAATSVVVMWLQFGVLWWFNGFGRYSSVEVPHRKFLTLSMQYLNFGKPSRSINCIFFWEHIDNKKTHEDKINCAQDKLRYRIYLRERERNFCFNYFSFLAYF